MTSIIHHQVWWGLLCIMESISVHGQKNCCTYMSYMHGLR